MALIKRSFPPIADARTRLLILGSLPGEASLAAGRYYAHPQNQFWRLLGGALNVDLAALGYDARLEALQSRRVGLWDVVAGARRAGSLDGAIRDVKANDLTTLVATLPELRAIAFNGGTAARIGRAALGATSIAVTDLPSSSPAYTRAFGDKAAQWSTLAKFLD